MIRMRTAKEAYEEIKEADPQTALSERAIKQLLLKGVIPYTPVGRKKLINMDILMDYYEHPDKYNNPDEEIEYGKIRAVQ
jgi:hypothetical protein